MAYVIVDNNNEIYRIAENDAAKNDQNCLWDIYSAVNITDAEFAKIKINAAMVTVSDGSATVTDIVEEKTEKVFLKKNYKNITQI